MKTKFKDLNGLLLFNWNQIKKNALLWILFGLASVSQLLIFIVLYCLNISIIDYSVLTIAIPNILSCVFMTTGLVVLFIDNKTNSIDVKLLCSRYSPLLIKVSRFLIIFICLIGIVLVQNIFLLFLIIVGLNQYSLIYFLSNTFITPFLLLTLLLINILITKKTSKSVYILLSILFIFLTFGLSLVTRFATSSSDLNNQNINISKLASQNNEYILDSTNQEFTKNQNRFINNFVPSEWLLTYYSSLFNNFNFGPSNNNFNLLSFQLINTTLKNDNEVGLIFRPLDTNVLNLTNQEYEQLIIKNIGFIVDKYDLLNNNSLLLKTINYLNSIFDWSMIPDPNSLKLITDITGVNTEYNQLFYLIKYKDVLLEKIPNIFEKIELKFNENVSILFENIINSNTTFYNLFQSSNEFNINKIYPNNYSINQMEPIINQDKEFIKNTLIKFVNNQPSYLTNNLTYQTISIDELKKIDNSIVDLDSWNVFVDSISLNYKTTNECLEKLNSIIPNIYNLKLSKNYLNFANINNVFQLKQATNTQAPSLMISILILINAGLLLEFFINKNKKRGIYE